MGRTLASYILDAGSLDEAAFCERHPRDVLVVEPYAMEEEPELSTAAGGHLTSGVPSVYPIESKEAHGMGDRITIGRTGNNDVTIPASDVSKFHGYLTPAEGGGWNYTDADSTFGSRLNGQMLPPKRSTPISCGDRLRVASVDMTLYTPSGLYAYLMKVTRRGDAK
ncbi:MAG TPA: hypothetical protein DEA08_23920 [Planctomycetes bacterium]|nr:hypothetical protein [Planctomycetota bacterium]